MAETKLRGAAQRREPHGRARRRLRARARALREMARAALREYQPLPHRCEPIRTLDGVEYVNDSKGTNPDSVEKALASETRPGGADRRRQGQGLRVRCAHRARRARNAAPSWCSARWPTASRRCGRTACTCANAGWSLERAVQLARDLAAAGRRRALQPRHLFASTCSKTTPTAAISSAHSSTPSTPNETATPKILTTRPAFLPRKPRNRSRRRSSTPPPRARMKPAMDDYDDDEPTTRLSSAFFVVLILHVVAVGGIYAFNSIKAHRRGLEPAAHPPRPLPKSRAAEASRRQRPAKPIVEPTLDAPAARCGRAAPGRHRAGLERAASITCKPNDTLTKIAASLRRHRGRVAGANSPKELRDAATRARSLNVPPRRLAPSPRRPPTAPQTPRSRREDRPRAAPTKPQPRPSTYAVQKGDTADLDREAIRRHRR